MRLTKKQLNPRKEPNQERAKLTVDSIVRATAHILEKEGFDKASTNKIAEKAGISIGSLYQYFPTKESILALMMENYIKKDLALIDEVLEREKSHDLKATIRVMIVAILESQRKHARFVRIFAQKIFSLDKLDLLSRMDEHLMMRLKSYLGPYEKELRTDNLDLSLHFVIQVARLLPISLLFQKNYKLEDERVVDEMVHMIYEYIKKR